MVQGISQEEKTESLEREPSRNPSQERHAGKGLGWRGFAGHGARPLAKEVSTSLLWVKLPASLSLRGRREATRLLPAPHGTSEDLG